MALDTSLAPLSGAPAAGEKLKVYQRRIDFSTHNLAAGAWFGVFSLDAGDVVVGGCVRIITAGTATCTFTVGTGSSEQLLGSSALDATAATVYPFDATAVRHIGDDDIDLEMEVAEAVLGVIEITALVLKAGDTSG
ncbi:MAG TPA: hypothetical protein VFI02_17095 [Armatimonadota bacterium]|nr:hypothetical protein [Armatimonadota bacterium]